MTHSISLEIIGILLAAGFGFWMVDSVGLYGSAESDLMKATVGGGSAYLFAALFWSALHR